MYKPIPIARLPSLKMKTTPKIKMTPKMNTTPKIKRVLDVRHHGATMKQKNTRHTKGAQGCYFLSSNIKQVSNKLGYLKLSWAILGNLRQSQAISDNHGLSCAI